MEVLTRPARLDWNDILQRPYANSEDVVLAVQQLIAEVRERGDDALRAFAKKFEGLTLDKLQVTEEEINDAGAGISTVLKDAIEQAAKNIEIFHSRQAETESVIETMPGVECWRKSVGIDKVGLYIPGGTAPLFSTVLMLGIPAKLAGCKEIILCTPAGAEGTVHPAVLWAARVVGIKKIYKAGGAQAIAAMAFGTETIPAVYKIFGPGNRYVTTAKQLVQMQGIAIDMPAGPSELCVIADDSASPAFVAADLLSQAEHGSDSQVLLISDSEKLVSAVLEELQQQLTALPRQAIAQQSLKHSKAIIVNDLAEAVELSNEYAPEHLIISCTGAEQIAEDVRNAGSVFIGHYSPESVGDYASGTNHTLPTNGFARAYSGVSLDAFVKKITYQRLSAQGLKDISNTVITMAEAEGLAAHAHAVSIRLDKAGNNEF